MGLEWLPASGQNARACSRRGRSAVRVQASPCAPEQAPAVRLVLKEETVVQKKKKILSLLPGTSGFVFSGGFQVSGTISRLHVCWGVWQSRGAAGRARRSLQPRAGCLLPSPSARGAVLRCKEMRGSRSLFNSRKATCWAKLKVERHERSLVSAVNLKACHSSPDPEGKGL